jgi:hypothetical protein
MKSLFIIAVLLSLSAVRHSAAAEKTANFQEPMLVLQNYLRATYARDYMDAYRYIASADRRVKDMNRYVQQRGAFNGFALELARKLAEFIEIDLVRKQETANHLQAVVEYNVPDPKKLSALLLNWDPYRLNRLSSNERKQLQDLLVQRRRDGSLDMIKGEEKFDLVKEDNEWRIFLNWSAGVKIPLRLELAQATDLEVTLSKNEVIIQPGDLFEVFLKIRNRSKQPITARIGHLVEPRDIADYLDFVQCGFLLPVTLQPEKEQEFSGIYRLRGSVPEGVRQLSLTYDFRLLK